MEDTNNIDQNQQNPKTFPFASVLPVALVLVGIFLLMRNLNLISQAMISNTFKLWPLLLVYLGLDYWIRSKPRLRTVFTILFISGTVFAILMLSS